MLRKRRGRSLVSILASSLRQRCGQTLFLLDVARHAAARPDHDPEEWLQSTLLSPLRHEVRKLTEEYKRAEDARNRGDGEEAEDVDARAERETIALLDHYQHVHSVGRYDGTNSEIREAHRRNFNLPYNPFLLLVSRVGEEGIDLQKQCRYIIHYDLEWNQAKMEQREGRVDRIGWVGASRPFIDVQFLLLKGTYEERIFHTVMQRDQWFQILIGSKRRELGRLPVGDDDQAASQLEEFSETAEYGVLTGEELDAVMPDLRPASLLAD